MADYSAQFAQVYGRLNSAQKKAVDSLEGPVMVVAGPGTGKTQVLAARIARILEQTDTDPAAVLALTFTESAAREMQQRLVGMIGRTGYYVQITTFHAFCSEVIQRFPEYFPIDRGSEPLTDLERYDLFQKIIDQLDLETLKPLNRPYFYLREVMQAISQLKKEGYLPDDFVDIVAAEQARFDQQKEDSTKTERSRQEKNLAKWQELIKIYQAYQHQLRASLRYDFDDMIALVVEAFDQHQLLLQEYQENIHYFLVDEYQDTNSAQNKVVDQLASYWGERANVFVVGDPNQSIYRFQGASVENVLGFVDRYPQAEVITLQTGYRCPQNVYRAAAELISHNQLTAATDKLAKFDLAKPLTSRRPPTTSDHPSLSLYQAPSQTLETIFIAEHIQHLHSQGVPLDEVAILYRHNRDVTDLQLALDKWGLNYEINGGHNLLDSEEIRQLLTLFQVMADLRSGSEDERLYEVLNYEWLGLDKTLVMRLGRAAGKAKLSLAELIDKGYQYVAKHDLSPQLTALEFEPATRLLQQLYTWAGLDADLTFPAWFEQVVQQSGFLPWVIDHPQSGELLIRLNSLFREVKALADSQRGLKLTDFLSAMATIESHGIRLGVEDLNVRQEAVHLSTAHGAKGREWSYVFVTHCVDGKWGNARVRELLPLPAGLLKNTDLSQKEKNEDDRRLFYVALTRAKEGVICTYPQTFITTNRSQEMSQSMFLTELKAGAASHQAGFELTPMVAQHLADQADQYLAKLVAAPPPVKIKSSEKEFFQALVANFKLSVTALNVYLRDPQEFVQNFLLRVPRAKPEPMAFGSAVHKSLEVLFTQVQDQQPPQLATVLNSFEEALTRELLTTHDFQRRLDYGKQILTTYFENQTWDQIEPLFIERFFGFGWSKTVLDDIILTGRIDRVDWVDKAQKEVRVIDYKTGRPKSKNYIEGKIASANLSEREQQLPAAIRGPYKRQLLFYKLLTELDRTFVPQVVEGVFEFVEPNTSGKLVSRSFNLVPAEVEALKDLIKEVMVEIRQLKFLDT